MTVHGGFCRAATKLSGAGVPPAIVLWPSRLKNHQPGRPVDKWQPGRLPHGQTARSASRSTTNMKTFSPALHPLFTRTPGR